MLRLHSCFPGQSLLLTVAVKLELESARAPCEFSIAVGIAHQARNPAAMPCKKDSDPGGKWCFVEDQMCEGDTYGYCRTTTTSRICGRMQGGEGESSSFSCLFCDVRTISRSAEG